MSEFEMVSWLADVESIGLPVMGWVSEDRIPGTFDADRDGSLSISGIAGIVQAAIQMDQFAVGR